MSLSVFRFMNKILSKFLNLTEKLHLIIYQIVIVFALFFYFLMKGATFLMSLYYLFFTFTFDYGFKDEVFFILIYFFFIPILFTWCNLYIIKKVLREIRM